MNTLKDFAVEILCTQNLDEKGTGYINYLVDDESVWEELNFIRLTNDEFVNSVFYDNKRTYREKLAKALELLENMGFEDYVVKDGKLYVKDFLNSEGITFIKYGIYKK